MNEQPYQPTPAPESALPHLPPNQQTNKSYLTTFLLSFFFGTLGVDRFYLGKIGTGILKLLTLGGFGVWQTVDLIRIGFNHIKAKDGSELVGFREHKKTALIIFLSVIALEILIGGLILKIALSQPSFNMQDDGLTVATGSPTGENSSKTTIQVEVSDNEAAKFVRLHNDSSFSNQHCSGEPATMTEVHIKGSFATFFYTCGGAYDAPTHLGAYTRHSNSGDDWEFTYADENDNGIVEIPGYIYNKAPEFYETTYRAARS